MKSIRSQLVDVARRKERLTALADAQRSVVAGCVRDLRGPLVVADRGLGVLRFLRANPVAVGVVAAAFVVFRGGSLLSLAGRGLAAWRLWRSYIA